VLADDMPREWTGLDAQDGDQLTAAGIQPGSDDWHAAEEAARAAYMAAIGDDGEDATYTVQTCLLVTLVDDPDDETPACDRPSYAWAEQHQANGYVRSRTEPTLLIPLTDEAKLNADDQVASYTTVYTVEHIAGQQVPYNDADCDLVAEWFDSGYPIWTDEDRAVSWVAEHSEEG